MTTATLIGGRDRAGWSSGPALLPSTSLIGDIGDKSICGLDKKSWSFIQMHLVWPNTWFNFINVHLLAKINFIHLWKRLDLRNIWVLVIYSFWLCLPRKRLTNAKCYHQMMLENQYFVNILGNWSAASFEIIQKESHWTNFDEEHPNLEYHDYRVVLPCILFWL